MSYPEWQKIRADLRARTDETSLTRAITIAGALPRWCATLDVTSGPADDLIFVATGTNAGDPAAARVVVRRAEGSTVIDRFESGELVEHLVARDDEIDHALTLVFENLTVDRQICRGCYEPSTLSRQDFELFERMHYVCFHYEFEHGDIDRDDPCTVPGCPTAALRAASR